MNCYTRLAMLNNIVKNVEQTAPVLEEKEEHEAEHEREIAPIVVM